MSPMNANGVAGRIVAALVRVFHREKIEHAFGPEGGGMEEILD